MKVSPRVSDKVLLLPLLATDKDHCTAEKEVTHLPEVTLYIKCPSSYPSLTPPDCHLSARWMDSKVTPHLVEHLSGMFVPGCPVVYEWVLYLQDEIIQDYNRHSTAVRGEVGVV